MACFVQNVREPACPPPRLIRSSDDTAIFGAFKNGKNLLKALFIEPQQRGGPHVV
jgi:hypothetical protein